MDIDKLLPTDDPLVMRGKGKGRSLYTERVCEGCGELAWMLKLQRFCSLGCRSRGANNPNWAGDDINYGGMHDRVRAVRGSADYCIHRNAINCTSTTYQWAQIHETSGLDIYDYVPMCVSCHNRYDYRGGKAGVPRPSVQGSKHVNAKFSDDEVREIRSRPVIFGSIMSRSREFGASKTAIRRVLDGETYRAIESGVAK